MVPPNAPPDRIAAVKASIVTMAYDTLGMVDLNKKDYAAAEQEFLKAVEPARHNPRQSYILRLSVAQDQLKKYPQALDSANKAAQYAPAGSAGQNLAKQQQARLQKLMAGGSSGHRWSGIPAVLLPPRLLRARPATRRLQTGSAEPSPHRPRRLRIPVRWQPPPRPPH